MVLFIEVLAGLVALAIIFLFIKNNQVPIGLGVKNGKFSPLSKRPNGVSTQTEEIAKKISPLPFKGNLDQTYEKVLKAIASYSQHHIKSQRDQYLHIVFKTGRMKYKDDAEFYFDIEEQLVHYRSASRIGYSDLGLNRQRYEAIRLAYLNMEEYK